MVRVKNVDKVKNTKNKIAWKNIKNGFYATVSVKQNGDVVLDLNGKTAQHPSKYQARDIASNFMMETAELAEV